MAANYEEIEVLSGDDRDRSDVSFISNVSLDEFERTELNRRKNMLEQELNSLSVVLNKSRKSKSVPNPDLIHDAYPYPSVKSIRALSHLDPRGATSITSDSPFLGFNNNQFGIQFLLTIVNYLRFINNGTIFEVRLTSNC